VKTKLQVMSELQATVGEHAVVAATTKLIQGENEMSVAKAEILDAISKCRCWSFPI